MQWLRFMVRWRGLLGLFIVGTCILGASVTCADVATEQIATWGFPVGEELVYQIKWGAIPVGELTVTTGWIEDAEGELLQLRARVRSNRAIALLYPVSIDMESVVQVDSFLPLRHTLISREGRRRKHEEMLFDHDKGKAHLHAVLRGRKETVELEHETRDLFTFLYYVRRYPMELGSKTHHRVLTDDKIYDLWLEVDEAEQRVSTLLDERVSAVAVEPEAAFEGVFRRQGRLEIHVSRDARQLMLQMRANVPIGSVRVELVEVRGPGSDRWGLLDTEE